MEIPATLFKSLLDPVFLILLFMISGTICLLLKKSKTTGLALLLLSILALYGLSIFPVSNRLCYYLEKDYLAKDRFEASKLDVVVVLGGGITENETRDETALSWAASSRLLHAVQVFRRSGADYLMCSGYGAGKRSEAETMALAAERLGVPKNKIVIDPLSRNTREHAIEMNRKFDNKDLRIGLVTSAFHMKRSERAFRRYFPNVKPFPSDYLYDSSPARPISDWIPGAMSLYHSSMALKEMAGIAWYWLRES